jgi:hypothetical protein
MPKRSFHVRIIAAVRDIGPETIQYVAKVVGQADVST